MSEQKKYDVAVIGAGVVGALIARELSRSHIRIVWLERCNDVAQGTTKANSAIVHAGFDAKPHSVKARMNVDGNRLMGQVCEELHVPFHRNGSLVVAFTEEEVGTLKSLIARGQENGVPDLRLLSKEELHAMEPNLNADAPAALYAPTGGIVSPYELCIAAAENAVTNGAELRRNYEVKTIDTTEEGFLLSNGAEQIAASLVINAAGVYADKVARMIGDETFTIKPRRGEYLLLDMSMGGVVDKTIFQCPSPMGKGVLITPTVHGNVLIGPSAEDIEDKEDLDTTDAGLRSIQTAVKKSVPGFAIRDVITSFTGLRAHDDKDDFIIGASEANPRFVNVAGIESPGLTAAPAIAKYVARLVSAILDDPPKKADWNPIRPEPLRLREMTPAQRKALIAQNAAYGRIICRCETVSEGEILDAIHAPAGARDIDGVKRRTRAGMGRCQGGFCGTKVLEILSRELGLDPTQVTKFGGESRVLVGKTK